MATKLEIVVVVKLPTLESASAAWLWVSCLNRDCYLPKQPYQANVEGICCFFSHCDGVACCCCSYRPGRGQGTCQVFKLQLYQVQNCFMLQLCNTPCCFYSFGQQASQAPHCQGHKGLQAHKLCVYISTTCRLCMKSWTLHYSAWSYQGLHINLYIGAFNFAYFLALQSLHIDCWCISLNLYQAICKIICVDCGKHSMVLHNVIMQILTTCNIVCHLQYCMSVHII